MPHFPPSSRDPNDDHQSLDFDDIPPFPTDVPTAPLLRISLAKLLAHDVAEEEALFVACRDLGFFYLDLRDAKSSSYLSLTDNEEVISNEEKEENENPQKREDRNIISGPDLLSLSTSLFALAPDIFSLPLSEKQKYDFVAAGSYFGYKGLGQAIVDRKGTRDGNEFWNLSKDDLLGYTVPRLPNPSVLRDDEGNRAVLARYCIRAHAVVRLMLGILETKLGLEKGGLEGLHRLQETSGDQIRWVRAPPQKEVDEKKLALGEHTDFGSVTLLFNRLGGLQILPPGEKAEWSYVRPLKGHCVVNLGDAMVKFTAGILRSNIHRVVPPPGAQASLTRWSLVYFNRPEDEVFLRPLRGSRMIDDAVKAGDGEFDDEDNPVKAKDWILRRAMGIRVGGDFEQSGGTDMKRLNGGVKNGSESKPPVGYV